MSMVRFGKHPAKRDYRTLKLKNYLTPAVPAPPASHDVLAQVYAKLGVANPTVLYPMDGNDQYGDCTIAALAHATTTFRGLVGKKTIPPAAAVVKLYLQLTGGIDSGLNELDVLNAWAKSPLVGEEILGYAAIDPSNHTHVQQAIWLFGGVYLGFQVPENCVQEFDARQPWTPGALTQSGHAVFAVGYDATGLTVLTWGNTQQATWAWWDECVDEAYAVLPPEAKQPGFAPGFDYAGLQADLAGVSNAATWGAAVAAGS